MVMAKVLNVNITMKYNDSRKAFTKYERFCHNSTHYNACEFLKAQIWQKLLEVINNPGPYKKLAPAKIIPAKQKFATSKNNMCSL